MCGKFKIEEADFDRARKEKEKCDKKPKYAHNPEVKLNLIS
jgi:hypothetical protein